jgi:hypothetical protein
VRQHAPLRDSPGNTRAKFCVTILDRRATMHPRCCPALYMRAQATSAHGGKMQQKHTYRLEVLSWLLLVLFLPLLADIQSLALCLGEPTILRFVPLEGNSW